MSALPVRPATGPLAAMPWWCSPVGVSLGFLLPVLALIDQIGEGASPALTLRGWRFLDAGALAMAALLILAIALGGWIGGQLRWRPALTGPGARPLAPPDPRRWDRAAAVLAGLALVAFAVLFRDFFLSPTLMWQTLTGAFRPDRNAIATTPGLTSLTNLVPVFFSIYAFRWGDGHAVRPAPLLHGLCVLLVLLTVFRVHVWSERLAFIEMLVPFGLAIGRAVAARPGGAWAGVRALGPYLALPLVVLFFGAAEYSRAWADDAYQGKTGFWEFALGRFASYYYTSLNNGAGLLATAAGPSFEFEHTLEWLHRAPFGLGRPFSEAVGFTGRRFDEYLLAYQDPEFNSPSGLFAVVADLGWAGALVYMLAIGLAGGLSHRLYREGRLAGVLLNPLCLIGLLEMFRYPYLGQPRAFTWLLGIGLAAWLARPAVSSTPRS